MKLPNELLRQLSGFSGEKEKEPRRNLVLEVFKSGKELTIDDVLIGVFKKHDLVLKRMSVYQSVNRLVKKGAIKKSGKHTWVLSKVKK